MTNPSCAVDGRARIVRLVISGPVSFEEWAAALEAVFALPDYQPGFGFLVDRRAASPPTTDTVRSMIAFIGEHRAECADSRWAIVVAGDADFGMVRMTQALSGDHPTEIQLFDDLDRAVSWLCASFS